MREMNVPENCRIRDLQIDFPLVLAPLAGITHLPFRRHIFKLSRPGLFFTEMLSARAVMKERVHESLYLQVDQREHPIAFQLVASTGEDARAATGRLVKDGISIIDLNLACPAPEIAKKRKAGAFLLNEPDRVRQMVLDMREVHDGILTAKIRLGYQADESKLIQFSQMLTDAGVDAITLHPRLTTDKLKRRSRWAFIRLLKTELDIPIIGNGDVTSVEDCHRMFKETGCDAVMIGREAVRRPWIFAMIAGALNKDPSPAERQSQFRELVDAVADFFPERKAVGRLKEIGWYVGERMTYGHHFASRIQASESTDGIRNIVETEFIGCCG